MSSTKQNILSAARKLFNQLGFSNVTVRMIAMELGMSSGNLNYHFSTREDILESLYFEMVEVFDQRVASLGKQELTAKFMYQSVKVSMHRMLEYRFFWADLYYLLSSNETINKHFQSVRAKRVDGYHFLFNQFIDQNILKLPSYGSEYDLLIERMIDYSNTWLYASLLYNDQSDNNAIVEHAAKQLMLMMYPYLKAMGKKRFASIIKI